MSAHPVGSLAWEREQALARQAAKTHGLRMRARAMRVLERRWNATPAALEDAIHEEFPWMAEEKAAAERAELLAYALELQQTERPRISARDLDVKPPARERLTTPKRPARTRPAPIDHPEPEELVMEQTPKGTAAAAVAETPLKELGNMSRVDPKLREEILAVITDHLREHPGATPAKILLLIAERFRLAITKPQATYLLGKAESTIRDEIRVARAVPAVEVESAPKTTGSTPMPPAPAAEQAGAADGANSAETTDPTSIPLNPEDLPPGKIRYVPERRLPGLMVRVSKVCAGDTWDYRMDLRNIVREEALRLESLLDEFLRARELEEEVFGHPEAAR